MKKKSKIFCFQFIYFPNFIDTLFHDITYKPNSSVLYCIYKITNLSMLRKNFLLEHFIY